MAIRPAEKVEKGSLSQQHWGRPSALSPADKIAARALLKDPAITVEEVAHRLRVSPATLYRHFPGGRSSLEEALR
jgi:transposase-like protein